MSAIETRAIADPDLVFIVQENRRLKEEIAKNTVTQESLLYYEKMFKVESALNSAMERLVERLRRENEALKSQLIQERQDYWDLQQKLDAIELREDL